MMTRILFQDGSEINSADLTPGQRLMIEDGLPVGAALPQEERATIWRLRQIRVVAPPKSGTNTQLMKTKKQHPADVAAESNMVEAVRNADHFLASLFKGTGVYEKVKTPTVAEALIAAQNLEGAARSTKRCMIYAVGRDARATLLTTAFINRMKELSAPSTEQETTMIIKADKKAIPKKTAKTKRTSSSTAEARIPVGDRSRYDWKGAEEKAAAGKVPSVPDFSAPTHARFIPILEAIKAACSAKDVKSLKAIEINPISSTPKAMDRYRNLCVKALSAKS